MKLPLIDRYDVTAAVIIGIFLAIALTAMATTSLTNDEIAHIPAGYTYLKTGDYRMNVEHPPLIKLIAGAALLPLEPKLNITHPAWAARKEWIWGDRFFFLWNHNSDQLLFWARSPIALIGALLIAFVYIWARELYGPLAGLLAGTLAALDPLITATSTIVHTDIGVTTFGFISTYFFWKFCHHRNKRNLAMCGIALGLALASKFTGVYFIAIFGVLALVCARYDSSDKRITEALQESRAQNLYILSGLIVIVGLFILIASYHFTQLNWMIQGFKDVAIHSTVGHNSFFHGTFSDTGFWYYFPAAFLIKTPLPTIILILLSILLFTKTRTENICNEWFLVIPAAMYLLFFIPNNINIGVRHIEPVYPFLFVFTSKVTRWRSRVMPYLTGLLLLWLAWNAYSIYPHHLSNFNELVGGPDYGPEWLIDSNIDWGQDLKGLGSWLGEHGNPMVLMAYFGNDDREYRGINWDELKCGPQPGLIAISVNRLVGFSEEDSKCSAWLKAKEPIAKIGYSIFIYNITEDSIKAEQGEYCEEKCKKKCHTENQVYISSNFDGKCNCTCSGQSNGEKAPAKKPLQTATSPVFLN
ncbi:MAG: glycosyltransferase family 39 protein [Nanoarchaeota archaeon]